MTKYKDGHRVIHEGVDTRGGRYWLVHYKGGSKYIWERGHVWAGYEVKNLRITYSDWSKRMRVRFEHPLLTSKGDSSAYCRCRCTEETASETCSIQVRRRLGSPIL